MTIKARIVEDLKRAMKAGEKDRVGVLRMLKSKIQEAEVSLRADKGIDYQLEDDEVLPVLARYAKQRKESIESFREVGRDDAVAREEAELAVVQEYLPKQLDADEIRRIVSETVEELGATSPKQMGAVMKAVMPKVRGAADGKLVNQIVRELLQG